MTNTISKGFLFAENESSRKIYLARHDFEKNESNNIKKIIFRHFHVLIM